MHTCLCGHVICQILYLGTSRCDVIHQTLSLFSCVRRGWLTRLLSIYVHYIMHETRMKQLPITYFQITNYLFPITNYLLPITNYLFSEQKLRNFTHIHRQWYG